MTTKHLSGHYENGYTLAAGYRKLVIDKTADVGGRGIDAPFFATIVNHGTVNGVTLEAGGSLINGSAKNTSAAITNGVTVRDVATVANFGTINGYGDGGYSEGVFLGAGGSVTNGSSLDTTALIVGYFGVNVSGDVATIANFGTIFGEGKYPGGAGVALDGGSLTNGSTGDTTALIEAAIGRDGVDEFAAATVTNFGAIKSVVGVDGYDGFGVHVISGGVLTNGSVQDTSALIYGFDGVGVSGPAATVANFGTIEGYNVGAELFAGVSLTNGSSDDSSALIVGYRGVYVVGADAAATIVNYATIEGLHGLSVSLSSASGEVIAEAGSTFIGGIEGGGGTLVLAGGGTGTISGLGYGGSLTGAVQATFIHFDTFMIEAGGSWTLAGTNKVDPVAVLDDAGTLINSGALTIAGTVSIDAGGVFSLVGGSIAAGPKGDARIVDNGLVIGRSATTITVAAHMFDRGVVEVATGTLDFTSRLFGTGVLKIDAGATLQSDAGAVATLTASFAGGAATLALKRPNAFDATLGGFASGDVIDLLGLKATGAGVNGADQLVVVNGARTVATLQLSGNYAGASFTTAADGHGGTNVALAPAPQAGFPSVHGMAAAMASLAAPAGVAALGHGRAATRLPVLATPNVHLQ